MRAFISTAAELCTEIAEKVALLADAEGCPPDALTAYAHAAAVIGALGQHLPPLDLRPATTTTP